MYYQRRDPSSSTRRFDYLNHIDMDDMNPINVLNILFQNPMDDMGATIDAIRASLFNVEANVEDARRRRERAEAEGNGDLPPPLEPVGGWREGENPRRTPTAVEREMLGLERLVSCRNCFTIKFLKPPHFISDLAGRAYARRSQYDAPKRLPKLPCSTTR